jgi:hypothetical protein
MVEKKSAISEIDVLIPEDLVNERAVLTIEI